MGQARRRGRAGFSLAEALVVLAITSLLLILLFSVATRATTAGFRLAGRALAASDREVGADGLRVLLRGVRLPGRNRQDAPFVGEPDRLRAAVVPLRSTACTGAAPAPALTLQLTRDGGRTRLVCTAPEGGGAMTLLDLGASPARFSYALAGRPWTDRLLAQPLPPRAGDAALAAAPPPRLWVRLSGDDGGFELIEAADPPAPRASAGG